MHKIDNRLKSKWRLDPSLAELKFGRAFGFPEVPSPSEILGGKPFGHAWQHLCS